MLTKLRLPQPPSLAGEGGFTLAVAMGIMLIASIVTVAAFQAAGGDLVPSRENGDRKTAYAAAESGIAWYQTRLAADPDYWQKCDTGVNSKSVADPVNQPNATAAARKWKSVSGSGTSAAEFSIAVMPANGNATCSTTNPKSMISDLDGSVQIRSTGRYRGEIRTIVSKFRRTRFLDYVYFTDLEDLDPVLYGDPIPTCNDYRTGRGTSCREIQFGGGDKINGPMHSNDSILTCGAVTFGRNAGDKIEVSAKSPGYTASCAPAPTFNGPFAAGVDPLPLPPSNSTLKTLTTAGTGCTGGYLLSGTQYIRFIGSGKMVLDTPNGNPCVADVPPNGVLYVQQDNTAGCSVSQLPNVSYYADSAGCPNVYVSGTVNKSITIASAGDIIVAPTLATTSTDVTQQFNPQTTAGTDADLTGGTLNTGDYQIAGDVQIGLIADGFVRVYHRVSTSGALQSAVRNVRIDAAILSLQHSFIVDNWDRGGTVGTLNVNGVIAQKHRGTVATSNSGTIVNGYVKNYWYDNRLRYRSPPYFLDPVNAAWNLIRENELVPGALTGRRN